MIPKPGGGKRDTRAEDRDRDDRPHDGVDAVTTADDGLANRPDRNKREDGDPERADGHAQPVTPG